MDFVDETLREWRRSPHKYGVNDCVLSAAAYFVSIGSAKAMPAFAGTYSDNDEAMDVLASLGGMERVMESIGGHPVNEPPKRGDIIGLVAETDYVIPALCTGDMAAARLERGVVEVRLRFVTWRGVWRGLR